MKPQSHPIINLCSPMRTSLSFPLSFLRSLTHHHHHRLLRSQFPHYRHYLRRRFLCSLLPNSRPIPPALKCFSTSVEHLAGTAEKWDYPAAGSDAEADVFNMYDNDHPILLPGEDSTKLESPRLEVTELSELPEQWRRAKLAWLCKELPGHKHRTLVRILNGQRKWMRQEDATYVTVHCTRIRENETAFRVYKWMMQQHWYKFDFALATKLADYLGKERKFAKCRDIFDDIINQGRVPSESTFHILIISYLSSSVHGCLDEACTIYNRMLQLGGYRPRLSLHNALFRALVSKPGVTAKQYLKQAEFIYHNLVTCGLEVQKDIFGGLIWLHSHQDTIDMERIASLREEMRQTGVGEGREVLVSVLRACSKSGDVEEAERTWLKLLAIGDIPSLAFVYRMEVFAKVGEHMKSFEIFREMQDHSGATVVAYHKIIEVLCKAQEIELAESLMQELVKTDMTPLVPAFISIMNMYLELSLHEKVESTFSACLEKCRPNRIVYCTYLDSLVKVGNLEKAEQIFSHMYSNELVGVNAASCNSILGGYISSGDYVKAEKIYDLICQKKFEIESPLMEKLEYVLSLSRKEVKKPVSIKLSKDQRETLVGLLLGGLQILSDEERKKHMIRFEFNENSSVHSVLRRHLHNQYHEWLHPSSNLDDGNDDVPYIFSTISHSYFGFYADQFWPKGRPMIPKLIHRWLSPRVLAYWYMYGGYRTSKGDVLLRLKGTSEGVVKVVKALKANSLDCRVKRKGKVFWIGILGSNSTWFWKLVEPYILDDLKDLLKATDQVTENEDGMQAEDINFDSSSDSDDQTNFDNA
ncbi:hypothetical protein Tsubulata_025667 [Turnera subulata]|uniref:Protein ORGANELLE TRANSCRIPT PROCESSING 51 n=1 Tax=Turnera subulata TaxID=218843 RepID=A0A9Q0JHJ9_9ROSI|nr:hypothetical protein Tsubulata_025667 [Turnera subulata]